MNPMIRVLLFPALVFAGAASASPPLDASPAPASSVVLQFASGGNPLAGVSFGLRAVDRVPVLPGQRSLAHLRPGLRTIEFTCPAAMGVTQQLQFDFPADGTYEVVCSAGKPASIRAAGC